MKHYIKLDGHVYSLAFISDLKLDWKKIIFYYDIPDYCDRDDDSFDHIRKIWFDSEQEAKEMYEKLQALLKEFHETEILNLDE
jgi:hypothetical protein